MKKKLETVLILLLMLAGVVILAYPPLSQYINALRGTEVIHALKTDIESAKGENLRTQRQLAAEYNSRLLDRQESAADTPDDYWDILRFSDGVMGYITIPDIGANLPIRHGVSSEVLEDSVGHLPQSAFPIGGVGNHSVLTGHTGLPSAELFTRLCELSEGDLFCIHILDDTLLYRVCGVSVVLPDEAGSLVPDPKRDLCTLVTCTPYGVNSHRLLVTGERQEIAEKDTPAALSTVEAPPAFPPVLVAAAVAAALIFVFIAAVLLK